MVAASQSFSCRSFVGVLRRWLGGYQAALVSLCPGLMHDQGLPVRRERVAVRYEDDGLGSELIWSGLFACILPRGSNWRTSGAWRHEQDGEMAVRHGQGRVTADLGTPEELCGRWWRRPDATLLHS